MQQIQRTGRGSEPRRVKLSPQEQLIRDCYAELTSRIKALDSSTVPRSKTGAAHRSQPLPSVEALLGYLWVKQEREPSRVPQDHIAKSDIVALKGLAFSSNPDFRQWATYCAMQRCGGSIQNTEAWRDEVVAMRNQIFSQNLGCAHRVTGFESGSVSAIYCQKVIAAFSPATKRKAGVVKPHSGEGGEQSSSAPAGSCYRDRILAKAEKAVDPLAALRPPRWP